MEVTLVTWAVALAGLGLIGLLGALQLVAVVRPRASWTIDNVYGGDAEATDPKAYFAFNQGFAWAEVLFWVPLQVLGCIGMLLGYEWGFLLALAASVPFIYTSIPYFVWDRDLGFRQNTIYYWIVVWAMWPVFGLIQGAYVLWRLLA